MREELPEVGATKTVQGAVELLDIPGLEARALTIGESVQPEPREADLGARMVLLLVAVAGAVALLRMEH